jgi:hypothetical protein
MSVSVSPLDSEQIVRVMAVLRSKVSETEAAVACGLPLAEVQETINHLAAEGEVACEESEGVRRWRLC